MSTFNSRLQTKVELGGLKKLLSSFAVWYGREFLVLFPTKVAMWLVDSGESRLALHIMESELECTIRRGMQIVEQKKWARSPDAHIHLHDFLQQHGIDAASAVFALRLPQDMFLTRHIDIPTQAKDKLDSILTAEIERKTPFQPSDVHHAAVLSPVGSSGIKLRVDHYILRRDLLDRMCQDIRIDSTQVNAIYADHGEETELGPPVIDLSNGANKAGWPQRCATALAVFSGLGFILALGMTFWRLHSEVAALDAQIAAASAKSAQVRKVAETAERERALLLALRHEKSRSPSLTHTWEELSRILPDEAWITELKLSETKPGERILSFTGLATSAANLVAQMDRSSAFRDSSLVGAITPDASEKRERFALQTCISPHASGAK